MKNNEKQKIPSKQKALVEELSKKMVEKKIFFFKFPSKEFI